MDLEESDGEEDWSKPVNEEDGSFCSNRRNSPKASGSDSSFTKKIPGEIEHPSTIIHIDMDCFYAQVEMIRNPSLQHVPLGVQQKNIIVTCNYPARALGVTKLMTIKDAKNKCPSLTMVSGEDLTEYRKMSYKISEYLLKYTKKVERLGFDENFLDVSELVNTRLCKESPCQFSGHIYGMEGNTSDLSGLKQCSCGCYQRIMLGSNIAQEIRAGLYNDIGVTCCSGISYNKLLAKLVGEKHKPNQQTTLLPEFTLQLLHYLPSTRNIPGIGYEMSKRLRTLDIDSVLDLYNYSPEKLATEFGQQTAKFLKDLSAGIDRTPVVRYGLPQSISDEDSYRDLNNIKDIEKQVDILVSNVLKRVVEEGRRPQTLRVTVRKSILKDDKVVIDYGNRESRQCPLSQSIFNNKDTSTWRSPIVQLAVGLLNKMVDVTKPFHLTLINICLTKFLKTSSHNISTFFSSPNSKPSNSEDDEFFTQRISKSKISMTEIETLTVQEEARGGNTQVKQKGMFGFFQNGGKRKESENQNNNSDTKRVKIQTTDSSDTSKLQIPPTSKLPRLDIDLEVFNQLPSDIQKEILNTHNISHTAPNSLKLSMNVNNTGNLATKSKPKVGIASFFNKFPKSQTVKMSQQDTESLHRDSLSQQCTLSSPPMLEPTLRSKLSSSEDFDSSRQSEPLSAQCGPDSKENSPFVKPSSQKAQSSRLFESSSSSTSQLNISPKNETLPNKDQLRTVNTQIPPNIDHSVFVTLPPDIQNELLSEWKASNNHNDIIPKKPKVKTCILEYFNKK